MTYRQKKGFIWLLIILCMGIIFWFSHQTAPQSSKLSKEVTVKVIQTISEIGKIPVSMQNQLIQSKHHLMRKLAHMTIYGVLGLLVYIAFWGIYHRGKWLSVVGTLGVCLIYAISDEWHQYFVSGRSAQVSDVMIDVLGAFIGVILVRLVYACLRLGKRRESKS